MTSYTMHPEFQKNRLLALQRANYKCEDCGIGKDQKRLEVHHLDLSKDNHAIDNLKTVCTLCHKNKYHVKSKNPDQKNVNEHVGMRIKTLRLNHGESLIDMQNRTGLDDSYLSRLETGQQQITVVNLDIFKVAYGLKNWSYFTKGLRGYND